MSIVRFASSAEVVIPFKIGQTSHEITKELDKIKFTGGSTRIANAIDQSLTDLSRWRRSDAIQVVQLECAMSSSLPVTADGLKLLQYSFKPISAADNHFIIRWIWT